MESVILVIHLFLALGIIGLVLIQRSEGGGLGIGGGGGGLGDLATAQGTANTLTRLTAIFATGFFITSLLLGIIAARGQDKTGLLDAVSQGAPIAIEENIAEEGSTLPSAPVSESKNVPAVSQGQPAPAAPISAE